MTDFTRERRLSCHKQDQLMNCCSLDQELRLRLSLFGSFWRGAAGGCEHCVALRCLMMPTRTNSPPNSFPQAPLHGQGMLWTGWQGTATPSPLAESPKPQEPGGAAGAEPRAGSRTRRAGTAGIPAEGQPHGEGGVRERLSHGRARRFPTARGDIPRCCDASHPETRPVASARHPPYLGGSVWPLPSEPLHGSRRPNELRLRRGGILLGSGRVVQLPPRGHAGRAVTATSRAFTRVRQQGRVRAAGGHGNGVARLRRLRIHGRGARGSRCRDEGRPRLREPARTPRRHRSRGGGRDGPAGTEAAAASQRRGRLHPRLDPPARRAGGRRPPPSLPAPYKGRARRRAGPPAALGPAAPRAAPGSMPAARRGPGVPPPLGARCRLSARETPQPTAAAPPPHRYSGGLAPRRGRAAPAAANRGSSAGFHGDGKGTVPAAW